MTPTELRSNLYRVLDEVAETGVPQQVRRGDRMLLIVPAEPARRSLDKLPRRDALRCTVDELIETTWEDEWRPDL